MSLKGANENKMDNDISDIIGSHLYTSKPDKNTKTKKKPIIQEIDSSTNYNCIEANENIISSTHDSLVQESTGVNAKFHLLFRIIIAFNRSLIVKMVVSL